MRAVLSDDTEIDCGNFKALDSGVVLTSDRKRKKVIGFVPMAELKYVVPDDFVASAADDVGVADEDDVGTVGSGETEGQTADEESTAVRFDGPDDGTASITDDGVSTRGSTEDDYVVLDVAEEDDHESTRSDHSELRVLGGLGSASAARLEAAGFGTIADLAAADPERVASETDIPPGRIRRWVKAAGTRREAEQSTGDDVANSADTGTEDEDAVAEEEDA